MRSTSNVPITSAHPIPMSSQAPVGTYTSSSPHRVVLARH